MAAQSKSVAVSKIPQEHFLGFSYIDVPTFSSDNSLSGPTNDNPAPHTEGLSLTEICSSYWVLRLGLKRSQREEKEDEKNILDTEDAGRLYPISGMFSKLHNVTSFSTWGKKQ